MLKSHKSHISPSKTKNPTTSHSNPQNASDKQQPPHHEDVKERRRLCQPKIAFNNNKKIFFNNATPRKPIKARQKYEIFAQAKSRKRQFNKCVELTERGKKKRKFLKELHHGIFLMQQRAFLLLYRPWGTYFILDSLFRALARCATRGGKNCNFLMNEKKNVSGFFSSSFSFFLFLLLLPSFPILRFRFLYFFLSSPVAVFQQTLFMLSLKFLHV